MKILILSFYYQPDLCAGSFRATALVNELLKHEDIELEIITTLPNRYASFAANADVFEKSLQQVIHRVELPSHESGMLDQIKAFAAFYKKAMEITKSSQYDLVFATSSRLFTAFLGTRIAKKKQIPIYLDVRDIFVDTIKDVLNKKIVWFVKPILILFERYTFKDATHINLVSEGFSDYFERRYKEPTYSFFTNGIDDKFLNSNTGKASTNPLKTILYAGNIGEGQGLHHIVPQLASVLDKRYQIRIIGDGGRKNLLVDSCIHMENVTLTGPVNRDDLLIEYGNADILFLHLNDYEAFKKVLPSKVFEYAATGKPILAGVAGYASEFISTEIENAVVFPPTNAKAALAALDMLALTHRDRQSFVEKFTRKNIMHKMAASIIGLVKSND